VSVVPPRGRRAELDGYRPPSHPTESRTAAAATPA